MARKKTTKTEKSTKTSKFMLTVLAPVLDDWNRLITTDCWQIEAVEAGGVRITDANHRKDIHGIVLTKIAGLAEAYDWCWALYAREDEGIEIMIH